jgi:SAM-dependent methyltransferase
LRSLRDVWDAQAAEWGRFVRTPGHDAGNERFNLPRLIDLLPPPGRRTLDLGCGEGRVGRALIPLGYQVVGVDTSPGMVELAAESQEAVVADAAALPFEDGAFDLVTAFMSLMDMDDPDEAIRETGRVLEPSGRFCFCISHPLMTAGVFSERVLGEPFVFRGPYFEERRVEMISDRGGIRIDFASVHRPLGAWTQALHEAGFAIEALREHPYPRELWKDEASERWSHIPLFLHVRTVKT